MSDVHAPVGQRIFYLTSQNKRVARGCDVVCMSARGDGSQAIDVLEKSLRWRQTTTQNGPFTGVGSGGVGWWLQGLPICGVLLPSQLNPAPVFQQSLEALRDFGGFVLVYMWEWLCQGQEVAKV